MPAHIGSVCPLRPPEGSATSLARGSPRTYCSVSMSSNRRPDDPWWTVVCADRGTSAGVGRPSDPGSVHLAAACWRAVRAASLADRGAQARGRAGRDPRPASRSRPGSRRGRAGGRRSGPWCATVCARARARAHRAGPVLPVRGTLVHEDGHVIRGAQVFGRVDVVIVRMRDQDGGHGPCVQPDRLRRGRHGVWVCPGIARSRIPVAGAGHTRVAMRASERRPLAPSARRAAAGRGRPAGP